MTGIQLFFDVNGNISISGLFDIHEYKDDPKLEECGQIKPQTGIMYLEAMLFAIDKINKNATFLYGNKLAARLFDSCSNQQRLKRNLHYALNYYSGQGMIGPQYSDDAMVASVVLNVFERSLISYSATHPDLDDLKKYPNFFRTVPSYYEQIQVMIDLALHFKWTYVSFLYSSGTYDNAQRHFHEKASAASICVPKIYSFSVKDEVSRFDNVLKSILKEKKIRVVFIFLVESQLKRLLKAAKHIKSEIQNLTFVGSDSWGSKVSMINGMQNVVTGSLTIQSHARHVEEFETYFLSLNPYNNKRNIWFTEFWEHTFNCSLESNSVRTNVCTGKERIRPGIGYYRYTPVQTVINAVYLYAHVFRKILHNQCIIKGKSGRDCIYKLHLLQGSSNLRDITDMLRKTNFEDAFESMNMSLSRGTPLVQGYDILNVKVNNITNEHFYETVGFWKKNDDISYVGLKQEHNNKTISFSLLLQSDKIIWKNGNNIPPKSICSDNCAHGFYRLNQDSSKCCWKCEKCGSNSYVLNNTCVSCQFDYIPDILHQRCIPLPLRYYNINNPVTASVLGLSCIGIFLTVAVIAVFLKNFQHRVIKASGRELCLNILAGIMITYLVPIIFLMKPSFIVCLTQKMIISTGLTLTFAPLALKLNRIYRIFKFSKKMKLRPPMISPKSQIVISGLMSLVGILLAIVSIQDDPPKTKQMYPSHRQYVIEYCVLKPSTFAINLAYGAVLMVVSTWYAFKTRHFPENFNETRYIGFTMYTTCLVLCGSLPPFFIIDGNGNNRVLIMCFVCITIASINLFGLFFPKLISVMLSHRVCNKELETSSSSTFQYNLKRTNTATSAASL